MAGARAPGYSPAVATGVTCREWRSPAIGGLLCRVAAVCAVAATCAWAAAPASADSPLYWSYPTAIDTQPLNGLSCASVSLCVGVDWGGNVVTSSDPTGGAAAWTATNIYDVGAETTDSAPNALYGVSCPQPAGSLCVAVGEGGIFTSSDPAGGAGAWTHVGSGVGVHGLAVSCPSALLCVAASGYSGELLTSTDPTGGPGAWKAVAGGPRQVTGVSCPTESLCVGVDDAGDVVTSSDPAGGAKAWTVTHVAGGGFADVSCPSASLCVTVGGSGVMTSTDPAGGGSAWTLQQAASPSSNSFDQVACASVSLCVASESNGEIAESADPTGGAGAWTSTGGVDGNNSLRAVACPSESLCFVADEALLIGVPAHTLSVSVQGQGTVQSSPIACPFGCTYSGPVCPRGCDGEFPNAFVPQRLGAIACSESSLFGPANWGTCSLSFPAGDTVTLQPKPAEGWAFAGWGGACIGSAGCALPMSVGRSVSATFAPVPLMRLRATTPTLTDVRQAHARWRESRARASISASRGGLPVGTSFSFDLNEAASVTLGFARRVAGRRAGRACAAVTRADVAGRPCTRTVHVGALAFTAHMGADTVRFAGRISRRVTLKPGMYTLVLTAHATSGRSAPSALDFTVVGG